MKHFHIMTNSELKQAYEDLKQVVLHGGILQDIFLCNLIEATNGYGAVLRDFKERLLNMDEEDWKTTHDYIKHKIEHSKQHISYKVRINDAFWKALDQESRIKFLDKIINSL